MDLLLASAAAAQGFDPELATRAYLDSLQGAARDRSDAYFEGGYWLILWSALVGIAVHWLMLRMGWSAAWRDFSARVTARPWLQPMVYAVPFALAGALLALPWTIYVGYFREKQYGLMNLSFGGWLGEQAIALVIAIITTAIILAVIFAVIRRAPRSWWLWSAGTLTLFLAFFVAIAPVFVSPLFNTYTPMPEGPMRTEILGMARAQSIPADNVYVFDASKQTDRISANVSGLGPTIRISLNDNLLKRASPEGVKAVMGHEMGHYVLYHVIFGITFFALVLFGAFGLIAWAVPKILRRHGERWRVKSIADPAVTPLFAILITGLFFVLTPITNSFVRTIESQADAFGLDAAREPDGFAAVAMQLSEYRKIEPSAFEEVIFYDHPSGRTRVRMAMDWKARHLGELPPEKRAQAVPPPVTFD